MLPGLNSNRDLLPGQFDDSPEASLHSPGLFHFKPKCHGSSSQGNISGNPSLFIVPHFHSGTPWLDCSNPTSEGPEWGPNQIEVPRREVVALFENSPFRSEKVDSRRHGGTTPKGGEGEVGVNHLAGSNNRSSDSQFLPTRENGFHSLITISLENPALLRQYLYTQIKLSDIFLWVGCPVDEVLGINPMDHGSEPLSRIEVVHGTGPIAGTSTVLSICIQYPTMDIHFPGLAAISVEIMDLFDQSTP